jgi:hypothetical protein
MVKSHSSVSGLWKKLLRTHRLGVTPHVLRHSLSIASDMDY